MADQDIISTQIFQAKDLPFKSVTVYEDQAEVHRKLVLTLKQGLNRIQVENLPAKLDSETFRVDGHGSATIHEVQFKNMQEKKDEDSEELKELKKQIKELEEKKNRINVSLNTYVKHLNALNTLTTNILKFSTSDDEKQPKLFDDAAEASLEKLFGYHEKKSSEIGIKGCQYEKEIKEIDEEIAKIKSKIIQSQSNMVNKRSVVILLEATQADAKIELDITYQSKNASWKSSYDFRVRTNGKSEENKLQLVYFGNIQQSTGEDWKDTELILSTGQLKSAGSLPTITQLNAKFKPQSRRPVTPSCTFVQQNNRPYIYGGGLFGNTPPVTTQAPGFGAPTSSGSLSLFGGTSQTTSTSGLFGSSGAGQSSQNTGANASTGQIEQPPTPPSVEFSECIASEINLSTTFVVPQKKNIPSDESEHKVTIATLELDSTFYYACVPKKNKNVFLTAEIKNTSEFPLLSGNASIYLNSAFSSTTSIERIDIGETFKRSLGTDPGIKVEYKPVKSTYEKKLGVVSSNVYEQVILVKNNKNEAIVMTIYEQIPKSTNENINIKLILPEIREESEEKTAKEHDGNEKIGAKLNKLNNLEWKIQLAPEEEKELTVKWSIDYPQNESLEYYESEIKEAAIKPFKF